MNDFMKIFAVFTLKSIGFVAYVVGESQFFLTRGGRTVRKYMGSEEVLYSECHSLRKSYAMETFALGQEKLCFIHE